ncbi:MAG: hypothetical protein K5622_05805 [Endomicrobiaceae bacterium]|nr:hypothetical protein [Endomicrobiaceae bacterium]
MKESLIKQCVSLFVIFFVLLNCLVLSFNSKTDTAVKCSAIEQILFAVNSPVDILSTMTQTDKTTQKDNNKEEQEKNFYEYLLPAQITIPNIFNFSNVLFLDISKFITESFVVEIEYPIKIPFWQCVFILFMLRLLFVVLPRSISVNYNKLNIDKGACIV